MRIYASILFPRLTATSQATSSVFYIMFPLVPPGTSHFHFPSFKQLSQEIHLSSSIIHSSNHNRFAIEFLFPTAWKYKHFMVWCSVISTLHRKRNGIFYHLFVIIYCQFSFRCDSFFTSLTPHFFKGWMFNNFLFHEYWKPSIWRSCQKALMVNPLYNVYKKSI